MNLKMDFTKDIYNDYDILNKYLKEKYDVDIPKKVEKNVFYKEGKLKILNLDDTIEFINMVSNYDLHEIKNLVLKDDKYWTTFKN